MPKITKACKVEGCGYVGIMRRGMCKKHYQRVMKYGDPHVRHETNPLERFMRFIVPASNGCWEWTGHRQRGGYGCFSIRSQNISAHRFAYFVFKGITDQPLDHLCRNRACANPDHLEAVTLKENIHRSPISPAAINARKTHCPKGHPYSGDNLYLKPGRLNRICRACRKRGVLSHA